MTEVLRKERRVSPIAIAVFLGVYAAALLIVLAPKDMFTATPGSLAVSSDE